MMIIQQLSVFLENKPGRLCAATNALAREGINISTLTLADTAEFGILRLIVDQPEHARKTLLAAGVMVGLADVIAVAMQDAPGGAVGVLNLLSEAGLNIEYLYACVGLESGKALMVVKTDDTERAADILHRGGYGEVSPADIYRL